MNRTPYYPPCNLVAILTVGSQLWYSVIIKDFFLPTHLCFVKPGEFPEQNVAYTWGDTKIPGIVKKNYLKYLYKFET